MLIGSIGQESKTGRSTFIVLLECCNSPGKTQRLEIHYLSISIHIWQLMVVVSYELSSSWVVGQNSLQWCFLVSLSSRVVWTYCIREVNKDPEACKKDRKNHLQISFPKATQPLCSQKFHQVQVMSLQKGPQLIGRVHGIRCTGRAWNKK